MIPPHHQIFRNSSYHNLAHHFAMTMVKLAGQENLALYLASGFVSVHVSQGNVCFDLKEQANQVLQWHDEKGHLQTLSLPTLQDWESQLRRTSVVGKPGENTPLILETVGQKHLLYLNRYWQYEKHLATSIGLRLQSSIPLDESLLATKLDGLFPPESPGKTDGQRKAAEIAIRHRFCVISGGPGTGKTTTVIKILALLVKQTHAQPPRIALAAPTGKAAARLKESIREGRKSLPANYLTPEEQTLIPEDASTLHRLLKPQKHSVSFRYNQKNPLPLDCLIVDEASMIDLALMSKLMQALSIDARLILLGDHNQLSSVEAGSVLGDFCEDFPGKPQALQNAIIHLQKSYRFDEKQGVGCLSRAILQNDGKTAWNVLQTDGTLQQHLLPTPSSFKEQLKQQVLPRYKAYFESVKSQDIEKVFALFSSFIILSPLRQGPYGVQTINRLLEELLEEEGWIAEKRPWYSGRPVMVTHNDYNMQLYNGDIGIAFSDPRDGKLRVFFQSESGFQRIALPRVPEHETAFAMTVHKSQGSEFDEVLLILPDSKKEGTTRELLYTGITRSRNSAAIWTQEELFKTTIQRRTQRNSALQEKLANCP